MYNSISVKRTGFRLKRLVREAGLSVKELQGILGLTCPQSIYRWYTGTSLPTVDHLYTISCVLDVPIEELLVFETRTDITKTEGFKKMAVYYKEIMASYNNPKA